MNIASVQKRKFLNNIYKLLYSNGSKPTDYEVRRAFNQYFKVNRLGEPIDIDLSPIQSVNRIDPNVLNELMINSILNLEVLYDCVMENNQEIFAVITALNAKMDNLRAKRKEIEGKIDQLIYSNANSDGFFYSFLENFSNTSFIDLNLTTAFVDSVNGIATIPKLVSEYSSQITAQSINVNSVSYSVSFNSRTVVSDAQANEFDLALDGLNDTYWKYSFSAPTPGIFAVTINIPISSSIRVSKIQGSIMSETPCSVYVNPTPIRSQVEEVVRIKDSKTDFNRFAFSIPADSYSSIRLTIFKSEPDRLIVSENNPYMYEIGIRDLLIGSDYYDNSAVLVSNPISLPNADNELLSISSVAIDVNHQVVSGTDIKYYIANNVDSAVSISDFSWIPIEPSSFDSQAEPNVVNLIGAVDRVKYIDNSEIGNYDYTLISLNSNSLNVNELNPTTLPFSDRTIYRIASVPNQEKFLQPYILTGLDYYRHYNLLKDNSNSQIVANNYKSLDRWADLISEFGKNSLTLNNIQSLNSVLNLEISAISSGIIETRLLSPTDVSASFQFTKSDERLNISIFLNGKLISDIPSGIKNANVQWDFVKGINNISIGYDKNFIGTPFIKLMDGGNISDYGNVFLEYFSFLDPLEFRRKVDPSLNFFTIDNIFGSKQILASKEISNRSILRYYSDQSEQVTAIRYRVDFNRYSNPLQSPLLDAIRIKFRHSDI